MITKEEAQAALEILVEYGQKVHCRPVGKGKALGVAITHLLSWVVEDVVDTAFAMLEDSNCHQANAAMKAVIDGKFKRNGRRLYAFLPECWSNSKRIVDKWAARVS